jgi:hypothetical protein
VPAAGPPSLSWAYTIASLSVGVFLIAVAIAIVRFDINLPITLLLMYAGVAACVSGIGATAAVTLKMGPLGQAGSAGGAAAIAILFCWAIGRDPPAKLSMTYYVNFPAPQCERAERPPTDLQASIEVFQEGATKPSTTQTASVSRAPGGNALKVTAVNVAATNHILIRLQSKKENKSWASALILPTEGFMNVNDEQQ